MMTDIHHHKNNTGGYVALMATIVIGVMLLVITIEAGHSGWQARSITLDTEAKEMGLTLAQGCAESALARLISDFEFRGDSTSVTEWGTCYIFPILLNSEPNQIVIVLVRVVVQKTVTLLEFQFQVTDIFMKDEPQSSPILLPAKPYNFSVKEIGRREVLVEP